MYLRHGPFWWPHGRIEAIRSASPNAACPGLHWNMAQGSDKSRQLHRLKILPGNYRNSKRTHESNTKECAINQTQTHNMGTTSQSPLEEPNTLQFTGKKVWDVLTWVYDVCETVFLDQTGKFPTQSQRGNKYIMVMVEIDSNVILVKPITSRNNHKLAQAYRVLMTQLQWAGIVPKKHSLDNEVSEATKTIIKDEYKMSMELAPPRLPPQECSGGRHSKFQGPFPDRIGWRGRRCSTFNRTASSHR